MKVLLIEDHNLFREGLGLILNQFDDSFEVIECEDATKGMAAARENADIGLVLLDYNLPDGNGYECLIQLQSLLSDAKIVMLSAVVDRDLIKSSLKAGAMGYITKNASSTVMLGAIQLVLSGGVYVPPEMIGVVEESGQLKVDGVGSSNRSPTPGQVKLTYRQRDVLKVMGEGRQNKEIARELGMSPSTVKVHVAAILKELGAANRTEAVNLAKQEGLL